MFKIEIKLFKQGENVSFVANSYESKLRKEIKGE